MKLLIASDIHGRIEAARKLALAIDEYQPEKILLLGDFLYNGPRNGVPDDYDPMAVCEILNKYASKVVAVRGNCDAKIDAELLEFPLEDCRIEQFNGFRCCLFHGDDTSIVEAQKGDILIYGHTHLPVIRKEEGLIYLNPGSVGFPKGGNPASYALIDGEVIEVRSLEEGKAILKMELR